MGNNRILLKASEVSDIRPMRKPNTRWWGQINSFNEAVFHLKNASKVINLMTRVEADECLDNVI
jgi:hypothetical protein